MILKIIFTWWNKQTLGTFLKTLFFGQCVGKDEFGNKYYKNKKDERWVVYSNKVEASKITSDWFMWIHHTIDKIPDNYESAPKQDQSHLNIQQLHHMQATLTNTLKTKCRVRRRRP